MKQKTMVKAIAKTTRRALALLLSFFTLAVLLTGCSLLGVTEEGPVESTIPADAIFPVMESEDDGIKASRIALTDFTLTIPDGYAYGRVDSEGLTTYYVWQDKADKDYVLPTDGDVLLYIFDGVDKNSPHSVLTDSQARSSFASSYFRYMQNSNALRLTADPAVTYTADDEHYVCGFTANSGEGFTTTYSAICYPKTYYGVYALQKVTDNYERRWCGFVFSNDSEGEIFKESEYISLLDQIKIGLDITEFYSPVQGSWNYDPMKDISAGRSYEQLLALFSDTYIYYVETIGKPWERENVDAEASESESSDQNTGEEVGEEIASEIEDAPFSIHFIDVGQADAALIRCDGEYMLIDGGNMDDSDLIYSVLEKAGANRLKLLVGTHAHEDHIGGLAGALNYATADVTLCPVTSYASSAFSNFYKYAIKNGGGIVVPAVGDTYMLGSATVTILGVNAGDGENVNNTSIVVKITYGETSFLFMADAEYDAEQALIESGADLSADVLRVGHHGSDASTSYVFLREVMPEHAVLSVGKGNEYGHPTDVVLSRLRDADAQVWRTDWHGDIYCVSDGLSVKILTETEPAAADSASQAVESIEAEGTSDSSTSASESDAIPENSQT